MRVLIVDDSEALVQRLTSRLREVAGVEIVGQAGSVPDAADLVVTDPLQAGVMAVMAVADTAKFTLERLHRRVF